jgi:hypothetical protein
VNSIDVTLWAIVIVLAIAAGRMSLPNPPVLAWREFFALALVTPVRGEVDKEKGDFKAWVGRCESLTGRGESDGVYDDPADFGPDYALANSLGMGVDWERLAEAPEEIIARLLERGKDVIWICRGGAMHAALAEIVPNVVVMDGPEADLFQELSDLLSARESRVVLLGQGVAAQEWTTLLHAQEGLRDRTLAVVGVQGLLDFEWMSAHFDHESMDTELERLTPYFQLAFTEDGSAPGWLQPDTPLSERVSVDSVELGPLPCKRADSPDSYWALALVLTLNHRFAAES